MYTSADCHIHNEKMFSLDKLLKSSDYVSLCFRRFIDAFEMLISKILFR